MEIDVLIDAHDWQALDLSDLARNAGAAVVAELDLGQDHEVSLLACDDARIAVLNEQFRGKPVPTNVLSWPALDLAPEKAGAMPELSSAMPGLGDIAIAFGVCAREAREQGKPFEDHVMHLLVHGMLHLLGFDHIREEDAALMEGLESRILAKLGIADPYQV